MALRRTIRLKNRKVELYRLTISGVNESLTYGDVLSEVHRSFPQLAQRAHQVGGKTHALDQVVVHDGLVRLKFLTFVEGHRPDVIDTSTHAVDRSPLTPSQTNVEWTHAVARPTPSGGYDLALEKQQHGIYPTVVEEYLQWMIERFESEFPDHISSLGYQLTVSVEPAADLTFLQQIDEMTRITRAAIRISRPNPGWMDQMEPLNQEAQASDAKSYQVEMRARRRSTLRSDRGIVAAIRRLITRREPGYAEVDGEINETSVKLRSEKLIRSTRIDLPVDDTGQVVDEEAWFRIGETLDALTGEE